MSIKEKALQIFKDKFEFQFTLYNGDTISKLIPSLKNDITNNSDFLRHTKYLHVAGVYKGDAMAAYLTIDIYSPNNKQLMLTSYKLRLDKGVKFHEVICLCKPAMATEDPEVQLNYEIKEVMFK